MAPEPGARPGHRRRPEADTDATFLFALFRATGSGLPAGLDPALADLLLRQQFAGRAMSYRAAHPGGRFEVVEVDGEPAGRLVTDAAGGALRLVDVALLPERRGRGIGTALVRALQGEAAAAGLPLRLSVMRANAGARRLYARLGFAEEGGDAASVALRWDP